MIYEISINPVRLDRPSRRSAVRSWKALEGAGEFAETRWRGFGEQQIRYLSRRGGERPQWEDGFSKPAEILPKSVALICRQKIGDSAASPNNASFMEICAEWP
jgi:hypothetical protein